MTKIDSDSENLMCIAIRIEKTTNASQNLDLTLGLL